MKNRLIAFLCLFALSGYAQNINKTIFNKPADASLQPDFVKKMQQTLTSHHNNYSLSFSDTGKFRYAGVNSGKNLGVLEVINNTHPGCKLYYYVFEYRNLDSIKSQIFKFYTFSNYVDFRTTYLADPFFCMDKYVFFTGFIPYWNGYDDNTKYMSINLAETFGEKNGKNVRRINISFPEKNTANETSKNTTYNDNTEPDCIKALSEAFNNSDQYSLLYTPDGMIERTAVANIKRLGLATFKSKKYPKCYIVYDVEEFTNAGAAKEAVAKRSINSNYDRPALPPVANHFLIGNYVFSVHSSAGFDDDRIKYMSLLLAEAAQAYTKIILKK